MGRILPLPYSFIDNGYDYGYIYTPACTQPGNTLLMKRKIEDKKERFSIKLIFNPALPIDAELIKALKQQTNMTAYIKFVLYQYINGGEKGKVSNDEGKKVQVQPSLHDDTALAPIKEKAVHQWDKDAAFADAFEPLK